MAYYLFITLTNTLFALIGVFMSSTDLILPNKNSAMLGTNHRKNNIFSIQ